MTSSEFLISIWVEVCSSGRSTGILLGVCTVIVLSVVLVLSYVDRKRRFYQLWNIPGPSANRFLVASAIIWSIIKRDSIKWNILTFEAATGIPAIFPKEKAACFWIYFKPVVFMLKPEAVEAVLGSNSTVEKSFVYEFLRPWFKTGLLTSKGSKWRQRRKLLTPAFHFRILDGFLPVVDYHSKKLIENLKKNVGKEPFDIVHSITLCTLDIFCETSMGKRTGAQTNGDQPYLKAMRRATEIFSSRFTKPWLWPNPIFYLSPEGREFQQCIDTITSFTRQVISERKKGMALLMKENSEKIPYNKEFNSNTNEKKQAFLDLLLHHHLCDGSISEEDIREEVDTFMFAGHDTNATGISWALYLLGLYPEVQDKAKEEVDDILDGNREITSDDLKRLKYIECVIKESQRLYPSIPLFGREIQEDIVVDGYVIPSGTSCFLPTYMLHRNPEVFPNPEMFDPDRFLPENSLRRHPYAYIPFSAGPRNCIGQRIAMMELKTVIARVLSNFTIRSVQQRDKLYLTAEIVLRSADGLSVVLENR